MRILLKSFVDFYKDDGIMLAGALSCFFMLAMVPFLLFLAAIFGYLFGHYAEFHEFFLSLVTRLLPRAAGEVAQEMQSLIHYREIGIVTLTLYGFFSYQLYVSLQTAVQLVFKDKTSRPIGVSILLSLLAVTLLVVFTIFSFGAEWILSWMGPLAGLFPDFKIGMFLTFLSRFVVPVFLMFLMATALYLLLPPRKVPLRHAALGGTRRLIRQGLCWSAFADEQAGVTSATARRLPSKRFPSAQLKQPGMKRSKPSSNGRMRRSIAPSKPAATGLI